MPLVQWRAYWPDPPHREITEHLVDSMTFEFANAQTALAMVLPHHLKRFWVPWFGYATSGEGVLVEITHPARIAGFYLVDLQRPIKVAATKIDDPRGE